MQMTKPPQLRGFFLFTPPSGAAWAVDFFFDNTKLSLGLWMIIAGTPWVPYWAGVLVRWRGLRHPGGPWLSSGVRSPDL